jgi:hypothetical protein
MKRTGLYLPPMRDGRWMIDSTGGLPGPACGDGRFLPRLRLSHCRWHEAATSPTGNVCSPALDTTLATSIDPSIATRAPNRCSVAKEAFCRVDDNGPYPSPLRTPILRPCNRTEAFAGSLPSPRLLPRRRQLTASCWCSRAKRRGRFRCRRRGVSASDEGRQRSTSTTHRSLAITPSFISPPTASSSSRIWAARMER